MPAAHPLRLRRRTVDLVRLNREPVSAIFKDRFISGSCLPNWMAETDADGSGDGAWVAGAEGRELAESGKLMWRLEVENVVLVSRRRPSAPAPNLSAASYVCRSCRLSGRGPAQRMYGGPTALMAEVEGLWPVHGVRATR